MPVSIQQVREHPTTLAYLHAANENLRQIGYTEHGVRHATRVSKAAHRVLAELGYPEREGELAAIAGMLHDIGNLINRQLHGQTGAMLAKELLGELGMELSEILVIICAIGNHEEEYGHATSAIAAALILADKADVHLSRVHEPDPAKHDIHDRVNLAVTRSTLEVLADERRIVLNMTIDPSIATVMDYFAIFLSRMVMCRSAAARLQCKFGLMINGTELE